MHKIAKITGSFLRDKKIVKSDAGFVPAKVDAEFAEWGILDRK